MLMDDIYVLGQLDILGMHMCHQVHLSDANRLRSIVQTGFLIPSCIGQHWSDQVGNSQIFCKLCM